MRPKGLADKKETGVFYPGKPKKMQGGISNDCWAYLGAQANPSVIQRGRTSPGQGECTSLDFEARLPVHKHIRTRTVKEKFFCTDFPKPKFSWRFTALSWWFLAEHRRRLARPRRVPPALALPSPPCTPGATHEGHEPFPTLALLAAPPSRASHLQPAPLIYLFGHLCPP